MSKFIDTLIQKIETLKIYLADEELSDAALRVADIIEWVDDEQGIDLDDALSDFEEIDIYYNFTFRKTKNIRVVELDSINAEADFDDLMQDFKQKYTLTEIY